MKYPVLRHTPSHLRWSGRLLFGVCLVLGFATSPALGQADQGTITGTVQDPSGAVVPGAQITLTNIDTALVLQTQTDTSGVYVFSPVKIGNYQISATAPGFETTTQQSVHLDVQQRLAANIQLKAGATSTTVTVTSAPPLLQAEEGSTGQVVDAKSINETPLNGRNWVYITQLTAGVTPPSGSRGAGKGDFNANGQRSEQNNFILDGVDNNNNVVDFLNGASYIVRPPPDALAEFKVQTGAYSAEFGHSAGAVVNASIKSGTNAIHGDLWEYIRNDAFDVRQFFDGTNPVPKYRQNQFGATLGFPLIKDKLFFFGDVEADRIIFGNTHSAYNVPTPLMRTGNFSELLNPSLTSGGLPVTLYQPGSGGTVPLACNGQANVLCPAQVDAVAQRLANLFPLPNSGVPGQTYNNYIVQTNDIDNTFQWDTRMDWNISPKDQIFGRFSYLNNPDHRPAPLGPILDGGSFGDTGNIKDKGENFAASETHVFSPSVSNEFRFGYNYGHFGYLQENANNNIAPTLGLGGIPYAPLNGGIPFFSVTGTSNFGSPQFYVSNEYENVFQVLDNVTKILGNHSIRAGVNFQHIRFSTEQPTQPRGTYTYTGIYTSNGGAANTGFGLADFLTNNMNSAAISNLFNTDDVRWDRAGYVQDDWKVTPRITLNLGVRYEYAQPYQERHGHQAAFIPTGPAIAGQGQGLYLIPKKSQNVPLAPKFLALLLKDNITLQYSGNDALIESQKTNVAPRFGFAYKATDRAVVRGGYGIFFGGLESTGYYPNLGENYPFEFDSTYPALGNCSSGSCPLSSTNGFTLENGFSDAIAAGLQNSISTPNLRGSERKAKTPYSQQYNLAIEYALSNNMVATASYVGSVGRHLQMFPDPNSPTVLSPNGYSATNNDPAAGLPPIRPFPDFGGVSFTAYDGTSNYNSLQTKFERRYSNGLTYLASYTYSHSLDDAPTPLGSTNDSGYRGTNIVPIGLDYANSPFDVRHRFTLNGNYQLPFGRGRKFLNQGGILDYALGGWASSLVFRAQTGEPTTVLTSNITTPNGARPQAIRIRDPFKGGGTPDPRTDYPAGGTCPAKVRTVQNWYNPCAFINPINGAAIGYNGPGKTNPTLIGGTAALAFLGAPRNQIASPGYERVDMSLFKTFPTFREQNLEFRTDVFNLLNTPAYGYPSNQGISTNGGQITGARFFQNFTPDSRFFQFALKYNF